MRSSGAQGYVLFLRFRVCGLGFMPLLDFGSQGQGGHQHGLRHVRVGRVGGAAFADLRRIEGLKEGPLCKGPRGIM